MKIICTVVVFLIAVHTSFSQASLVRNRLQAVAMGKVEEVKRELPDLLAEFPDDPGIQFLHGIVLEDAARALKIYEKIIKDHPECEWSDDSQWRIVQFYALKRDTVRARKELKVYREKYPQSEFLLNASEMVKATVGVAKLTEKSTATETKPAPAPGITIPAETKPATAKPIETKQPEATATNKPVETKTAVKPLEAKPTETKSAAKPVDAKTSAKPADTKAPAKPTDTKKTGKPTDTKIQAKPTETKPADPKAAKAATTKVEPKTAPKTDANTASPKEDADKKEVWSLQVGSYDSKETAETQVKQYKQKRLRAVVVEKTGEAGVKYAVFIGEYTSKESAEKAKVIVEKSCNCTPFVVVR